jgi:hypothetical protein
MTVLLAILKDLLHLLVIVDMGAGAVLWAMAIRESLMMAGHTPAWRGWLTLRRPLASDYSDEYRSHRGQMRRLLLAFSAVIGIGALLIVVDHLLFKTSGC